MKALFTICLWPMALVGAGLLAAVGVGLVRLGWDFGGRFLRWLTVPMEKLK